LLRDLLSSGFSAGLARNLVERLPDGDARTLNRWAKKALAKNLPVAMNDEIVSRGGVYALTGPTGVGKTTTTAKLAARCVVRHGADKLALITTDSYRIGAYEHLKIYGRILGVAVHAARDEQELKSTLTNLRGKHVVLIDTIGMSQRDKQVAEQVAMLAGAGPVQRLLLLNATCHAETLEDVVKVYGGPEAAGCILTKIDEAPAIGAVLDVILRHKLKLHFVANGQRVPEDLHAANRNYLIDRALRRDDSELTSIDSAGMAALVAGNRAAMTA
jgi:flagellar biosynthesis protein FlhF